MCIFILPLSSFSPLPSPFLPLPSFLLYSPSSSFLLFSPPSFFFLLLPPPLPFPTPLLSTSYSCLPTHLLTSSFAPQVQLQNMMTSKFVGYFLEEVSNWQKKLATADSVITIWFEVQRTWSHLESIFIGSEDIRAQLPTHSKQFDTIDTDFKVTDRHTMTPYYKAILVNITSLYCCVCSTSVITYNTKGKNWVIYFSSIAW